MTRASVELEWLGVRTRRGEAYSYPDKRSAMSKEQYSVPAVYRWKLQPNDGKPSFLVGETEDLYRSLGEYLEHKNKHHTDLRKSFDRCRLNGRVTLEILDFHPFEINGVEFSKEKLFDPFVRGLLENLCCALLQISRFELLNETFYKRAERKLVKLEKDAPGTIAALLQKVKVEQGKS